MTRLIDADAIEYHMMAKEDWLGCTVEDSEMVWKVDIDAMPTVDAVPIIRCKDCKFWNKHDGTFPDFDGKEWHECKQLYPFTSASGDSAVTPSWFYCGYAERREE